MALHCRRLYLNKSHKGFPFVSFHCNSYKSTTLIQSRIWVYLNSQKVVVGQIIHSSYNLGWALLWSFYYFQVNTKVVWFINATLLIKVSVHATFTIHSRMNKSMALYFAYTPNTSLILAYYYEYDLLHFSN